MKMWKVFAAVLVAGSAMAAVAMAGGGGSCEAAKEKCKNANQGNMPGYVKCMMEAGCKP